MKEKESRQEGFTKNKKIITIGILAIFIILIVFLLIFFNRKIKYDITFETNGGSLVETYVETYSVDKNGLIIKPEDPVREGYVFLGWYYNGELFDFSTPITSDMVLEARWAKIGEVTGVKLNKTELNLYIGDTTKLIATVMPENATNKTVTWESSNPDVVSVDSEGNVKALKEGTATITVTTEEGKFTATVKITVTKKVTKPTTNDEPTNNGNTGNSGNTETTTPTETVVKVTGVSLDKTTLTLTEGDSSKLTATVNPSNANNKNVTWVSSNTSVVTVDSNGNVKALKDGTATITVTTVDGEYTATCQVTVNEKPASYSVTLTAKEEVTGVFQYLVSVTKNNSSFSAWEVVKFNEGTIAKPGGTVSSIKYDGITSATIILNDGSTVTATVNK